MFDFYIEFWVSNFSSISAQNKVVILFSIYPKLKKVSDA
jgi:hypothetical protein